MIFAIIILLIIAFLLSAYFTGRKSRSYKIIPFHTTIRLGDEEISTFEFANRYQPKIFSNPQNPSQPILWTWYEIIESENTYDIVYYNCWENEISPKKSFDFIYKIFRSVYFGYPLYDIEYLMVKVSKNNYEIENVTFETSISNDYNKKIVTHYINFLNQEDKNIYTNLIKDKKGKVIRENKISIDKVGFKIHLGIQTWNHMLCPISNKNRNVYSAFQNSPKLKELSDTDYKKYKFSRKSQSEHKTETEKVSLFLLTIVFFSLFTYPLYKTKKQQLIHRTISGA